MKKFLLLTGFIISFFSCSEELEFNTPSFQGEKNASFWQATDFNAITNEDGSINLVGILRSEVVTLNVANSVPGIYSLGANSQSKATFEMTNSPTYSTTNQGDGEIVIEAYNVEEQTITGTFNFNAFSSEGETLNFNKGIFYRIPILPVEDVVLVNQFNASVDEVEMDIAEVVSTFNDDIIEITGMTSDSRFITLSMPESIAIGSYNLGTASTFGTYAVYGLADGATSNSQFGTLLILDHDRTINRIRGTFVFNTLSPNSVEVDNGTFAVFY